MARRHIIAGSSAVPILPKQKIVFYTKPHCPLCDKALRILRDLQKALDFDLHEVNILSNASLYEKYKQDIPVAELDGQEIFHHFADVKLLRKTLKK